MLVTSTHRAVRNFRTSQDSPVRKSNPHFGLNPVTKPAEFFQLVRGNFVWEFLMLDVAALWLPRIFNSLRRGAKKYDQHADPEAKNRHPIAQFGHWIYKTTAGLNYANAFEETMREMESGPVMFIMPSVVMATASAMAWGRLANTMSHGDLKRFHGAFKSLVDGYRPGELNPYYNFRNTNPGVMKYKLLRDYMNGLLKQHFVELGAADKTMQNLAQRAASGALSHEDKLLVSFIKHTMNKAPDAVTYSDVARAWASSWAENAKPVAVKMTHDVVEPGRMGRAWNRVTSTARDVATSIIPALKDEKSGVRKALAKLTFEKRAAQVAQEAEMKTILDRLVFWSNEGFAAKAVDKGIAHGAANPSYLSKIHIPSMAFGEAPATGQFFEKARKFRSYITNVVDHAHTRLAKMPMGEWVANIGKQLTTSSDELVKFIMPLKVLMAVSGTLLAGISVVMVSALAQSGKEYPANEYLKLENLDKPGNGPAANSATQQAGGSNQNRHSHRPATAMNFMHQSRQPGVYQPAAVSFAAGYPQDNPWMSPPNAYSRFTGGQP